MNLIEVKNLTIQLANPKNPKKIVDHLSFSVAREQIMALVGGSGSGKTTTGLSLLHLLPEAFEITEGQILFEGRDLLTESEKALQKLRGKEISMVFQEPLYAFNPLFTIDQQIDEVLVTHTSLNQKQREDRILELLRLVEIDDPKRIARSFPHQLSGGLRQRAMIALAICANPKLIIADEPTSNLDVTIQARIIELFRKLRKELKLSILLITHDLGMVAHLADEMIVLKEGMMVEQGKTDAIMKKPSQNYTKQLLVASLY